MTVSLNAQSILTEHGTVLFVDRTGTLVHGRSTPCRPPNVSIIEDGETLRFFHIVTGEEIPIRFNLQGTGNSTRNLDGKTSLRKIALEDGTFALECDSFFLSAIPSGELILSAPHVKAWEQFKKKQIDLTPLPNIAAFTMVYNEDVFLPIWVNHYSRHLGSENIFIIDHGSTDLSVVKTGTRNVIRLPRGAFDEDQRCAFISSFQATLLSYYDAVIFSDADEILVPNPQSYFGLRDFAKQRCHNFTTAIGVDVLHFPEVEAPLNLTAPILSQRKYAQFKAEYCKSLLSEIPLKWSAGFHACQYKPKLDNDLILFHLKLVDRDIALRQLSKRRTIGWSENSLSKQHSVQFRLTDDQFISEYYSKPLAQQLKEKASDFLFSEDVERLMKSGAQSYQNFHGAFAEIPHYFSCSIAEGFSVL